ncbi:hypothetical protein [Pseudoalteromonas rubra]|uniref:hypothetical protein n=1 Tax=Pseudoalteromonas rubra TaxID=43658 RepID=UPI002DB96065|nr:hypothetical protein [Pseudoalteromonas rubra]MEC4088455.1 hypothetical protein [Pseudoalteromonas rubra]
MRKECAAAFVCLSLFGCSEPSGPAANARAATSVQLGSGIEPYALLASELLTDIRIQRDAGVILARADDLIQQSDVVLDAFKLAYPQCRSYLDAVLRLRVSLAEMSLAALEQDYHGDGKLPELPDPVCYHSKDLVVHPATVLVMAKGGLAGDDAYLEAELEMVEVMAHIEQVKQAFKRVEMSIEQQGVANDSTSN